MTTARIQLDHTKTCYEPGNLKHRAYIKQELDDFNKRYKSLYEYDNRQELLISILGVHWLFTSLNLWNALSIATTYIAAVSTGFGRPELDNQHQTQLNKLYDLYAWCLASCGKSITSHDIFLELTKTILPFISYSHLKLPLIDWRDVSSEFMLEVVNNSRHRPNLLSDLNNSQKRFLDYIRPDQTKQNEAIINEGLAREGNTMSHRGQSFYENSRFFLYGRNKSKDQQPLIEKASQWLEPLKKLTNFR